MGMASGLPYLFEMEGTWLGKGEVSIVTGASVGIGHKLLKWPCNRGTLEGSD